MQINETKFRLEEEQSREDEENEYCLSRARAYLLGGTRSYNDVLQIFRKGIEILNPPKEPKRNRNKELGVMVTLLIEWMLDGPITPEPEILNPDDKRADPDYVPEGKMLDLLRVTSEVASKKVVKLEVQATTNETIDMKYFPCTPTSLNEFCGNVEEVCTFRDVNVKKENQA